MNAKIWFIPAGMVAIGILLLSTVLSFPVQVEGVGYLDKIEHCFAYFVLCTSFLFAFKKASMLTKKWSIILLAATSVYGLGLEFAQYTLFPNRYFEWLDAGANVLGAFIGFCFIQVILSWLRKDCTLSSINHLKC